MQTVFWANRHSAGDAGGRLTIETANVARSDAPLGMAESRGGYVLLAVHDTGHGIDAETQAHLFEPFFTTKGVGEGTGLGLDTVNRIVRQHRGQILVESRPGETKFQVGLPIPIPPPDRAAADS